jgi:hypothetical protein
MNALIAAAGLFPRTRNLGGKSIPSQSSPIRSRSLSFPSDVLARQARRTSDGLRFPAA